MKVYPLDHPQVPPHPVSARFRTEIVYFSTPAGEPGAPPTLGVHEYWVSHADAKRALDDFVVLVVSPLDAASKAEISLSEEHEAWLEWMVAHGIQHVRVD